MKTNRITYDGWGLIVLLRVVVEKHVCVAELWWRC